MKSIKEQKLEILMKYGVRDRSLHNSMNSFYESSELKKCFAELERDLDDPKFSFHLVKPQIKGQPGGGPNFFIKNKQDIEKAKSDISLNIEKYDKIWRIHSSEKDGVNGRIAFDMTTWIGVPNENFVPCVVEITDSKELRDIEKHPRSERDYILLSKGGRLSSPIVEKKIINNGESEEATIEKVKKFDAVLRQSYKNLVDFAHFVKISGGNAVSFDFRQNGRDLVVFDFDCDNEEKVIETLLTDKKKSVFEIASSRAPRKDIMKNV